MKKIVVPISFLLASLAFGQVRQHTVQPKETIYRLSKEYGVTQEELKKANPFLYERVLQIGDVLTIPGQVAQESQDLETPQIENYEDDDFFYRTTLPKETLYGLSKEYNIDQNVIISLNPYIKERGLQIGDVVRLPKPKNQATQKKQATADGMYEVKAGDTVYSIAKAHRLDVADIYAANKDVQVDGLKVGSYIRIPEKKTVTIEKDWFQHQVQKDETIFGLMRKYSVTLDELLKHNPELSGGLRAGMTLNVPMEKGAQLEEVSVVDATETPKEKAPTKSSDASKDNEINIAWFMPFYLDQPNAHKGERKVAQEFYMGAQVALDELVKKGRKVNVKVVDTQNNIDKLNQFLNSPEVKKYDAIVGPFYQNLLEHTAEKLQRQNIAIFSPIVNTGKLENYENLYLAEPRDEYAADIIAEEIGGSYTGQTIKILTTQQEKGIANYLAEQLRKKYKNPPIEIVYNAEDLALKESPNSTPDNKKYIPEIAVLASENENLGRKFVDVITEQNPNDINGYSVYFVLALDVFSKKNVPTINKLKNIGFTYTAKRMINGFGDSEKQILAQFEDKYCQKPTKYMALGYDIVYDVIDRMDESGNISNFDMKRNETRLSGKIGYQKADTGQAKVNKQIRIIRLYNQ